MSSRPLTSGLMTEKFPNLFSLLLILNRESLMSTSDIISSSRALEFTFFLNIKHVSLQMVEELCSRISWSEGRS